jgi:HEAT repeats
MRRLPLILALLAGATAQGATVLTQQAQNVLTTFDIVPTEAQLDTLAFSDHTQALQGLTQVATDVDSDIGVRLRAVHALSKYCASSQCLDTDTAHQSLVAVIANCSTNALGWQPAMCSELNPDIGTAIVLLRSAVEALGPQRVGTDVTMLEGLLTHPSRDVRAATVHALRDLCNTQAIGALRTQQQNETTDQVRQAITEALRVLGQPEPCQ